MAHGSMGVRISSYLDHLPMVLTSGDRHKAIMRDIYITPVLVVLAFVLGSAFNRSMDLVPIYNHRDLKQAVLTNQIESLKQYVDTIKVQSLQLSESISTLRHDLPVVVRVEDQKQRLERISTQLAVVDQKQSTLQMTISQVSHKLENQ